MNTVLSQVTILFKNRRKSVLYISLAILTVAVEEIFEQIVFNCPCVDHMAYGMAFILAPALLLFILGFVLDKEALVVLLPCTKSYNGADDDNRTRRLKVLKSLSRTFEFVARACGAPMVWVVLSLLRKQYYVCAVFGPPVEESAETRFSVGAHQDNITDECGNTELLRERLVEQTAYQTYSQVLGCWLMAAAIGIFLLLVVLRRFFGKRRHLRLLGNHIYQHIEAKAAMDEFHKEAKRLAEENGRDTVQKCFRDPGLSGNFIKDIATVRFKVVARYNQYTIIPESPTSPVAPVEDGADGAGADQQEDEATSTPATPDRENMYIDIESRNMTRVIYLRETTT